MASNFNKAERYVKQGDEYKLLSYATSSESVEMSDGIDLETKMNTKVDKVSGKGLSANDYTTTEKTKLSGIATGAEVNQNAFSNVKVGTTTVAADAKTDTLELVAGENVTITPDATNDKITISSKNTTYSTATTSASGLMSSTDKTKLDATNVAYGTCSTAAATAAKVITISGNTNWKLSAGSIIVVKFSATNTASNPTFNVNSTGAKSVWYNTAVITTSSLGYAGTANRPMIFAYDGTQFVFIGWSTDSNTTYSNASLGQGYGTCATAEATTAKVVTLSSYALTTGGIVAVKFTYAVPASATMNINSKGAKNIFYRGSAITAGVIKAGDIATFIYDGTQYHLLTIDKGIHPTITVSTNTTSTASPSAGGTFTAIDSITKDSNGHVTKFNTKTVTLPSTSITVDSALSSTSTNPVQNKVINNALDEKLSTTGNSQNNTVTFTSNDDYTENVTSWTDVPVITSGEKHSALFNKISTMLKNIRYLLNIIGNVSFIDWFVGNNTGSYPWGSKSIMGALANIAFGMYANYIGSSSISYIGRGEPTSIGGAEYNYLYLDISTGNVYQYKGGSTGWQYYKHLNTLENSILSTVSDCTASTTPTDIAGASAIAELNDRLNTVNGIGESHVTLGATLAGLGGSLVKNGKIAFLNATFYVPSDLAPNATILEISSPEYKPYYGVNVSVISINTGLTYNGIIDQYGYLYLSNYRVLPADWYRAEVSYMTA